MKAKISVWLLVLGCVWSASAAENDELSRPAGTAGVPTEAVSIRRVNPDYPDGALFKRQEGWVMVSYTIDTEGKVIEPMIEDSSGIASLEQSALKAVRRWQYAPALLDGTPVEQSMVRVRLNFALKGEPATGASSKFVHKFREINDLIVAKDLAKAEPLLTDLQDQEKHNLYEDAWFWLLKYRFLDATGTADNRAKRDCLRKAIGYEGEYLKADQFVVASQELYRLAVEAHDYSEALETFERLEKSKLAKRFKQYDQSHKVFEQNVAILRNIIASDQTLSLDAQIEQYGYWHHTLLRRSFAIDEVAGRIELVDIRCDKRTQRFSMSTTSTWTVPESWGACRVYLKGDDGTTFTFHELPAGTAAR